MSFSKPPHSPTIPIKPHTFSVPSEDIAELRTLLKSARLTKRSYENSTEEVYLGVKRDWVEEARRYWLEEYDWCVPPSRFEVMANTMPRQKQLDRLNTFPQFVASLKTHDGLPMDIHFAAIYSSKPDAKAVVFSHGWPGAWMEFIPMMEMVMKKYTPETLP